MDRYALNLGLKWFQIDSQSIVVVAAADSASAAAAAAAAAALPPCLAYHEPTVTKLMPMYLNDWNKPAFSLPLNSKFLKHGYAMVP
jgi:hypothetical protein